MELAIRIIVVLFVTIVVGALVVVFSQRVLLNAQDDLNAWKNDPEKRDMVIDVATISEEGLVGLANECVRQHHSITFERTICFAVFVEDGALPLTADGTALAEGYALNLSGVDDGDTAFKIIFDPETDDIEVTR